MIWPRENEKARHSPGISGNGPSRAVLTVDEDKLWVTAFCFAVEKGQTDLAADAYAARIVKQAFPRLRPFAGFEAGG